MRTIAAIRTHAWGEDQQRLHSALSCVDGLDLAVVFHDREKGVEPPLPVADINDRWVRGCGLRRIRDWGWRCGDYFFYRLREAFPDYDHYWLVEPDVYFTSDPSPFFSAFRNAHEDVLGLRPEPRPSGAVFASAMKGMKLYRAIFALTRISGRALDSLFELRRDYCVDAPGIKRFANDETFVYSSAMARDDMSVGDLADYAGDWFDGSYFDTDPDILLESVSGKWLIPNKLYHPVRGKASFKEAVADRLTNRTGWVSKLKASIDELSDEDIDDVVGDVAVRLGGLLRSVRSDDHLAAAVAEERRQVLAAASRQSPGGKP